MCWGRCVERESGAAGARAGMARAAEATGVVQLRRHPLQHHLPRDRHGGLDRGPAQFRGGVLQRDVQGGAQLLRVPHDPGVPTQPDDGGAVRTMLGNLLQAQGVRVPHDSPRGERQHLRPQEHDQHGRQVLRMHLTNLLLRTIIGIQIHFFNVQINNKFPESNNL